jgi:hypothetical protein
MSKVDKVWRIFLLSILSGTFSEFLDGKEIENRISWILGEKSKIKPELLYKNILFMMNSTPISKIAIDYKLHFLLDDDYKELFRNPISKEFTISENGIDDLLLKFSMFLNHYIDLKIIDDPRSFDEILEEHIEIFTLPNMNMNNKFVIKSNSFLYTMTLNQLLYFVVFNVNPFNELETCNFKIKEYVEKYFKTRMMMMEIIKKEHPNVPLKYVISKKIF